MRTNSIANRFGNELAYEAPGVDVGIITIGVAVGIAVGRALRGRSS